MVAYNLAAGFQNRIALPLYMELPYSAEVEHSDIELTTHDGQECDLILRGHMKIQIGSTRRCSTRATVSTTTAPPPTA